MKNAKKYGILGFIVFVSIASATIIGNLRNNKNHVYAESAPYTISFSSPLSGVNPCGGEKTMYEHGYFKQGVGTLGVNGEGIEFQLRSWQAVESGVAKFTKKDPFNFGNVTPINGMYRIQGNVTGTAELSYGMGSWNRPYKQDVSGDFTLDSGFDFTHFAFEVKSEEFTLNSLTITYSCVDSNYRGTAYASGVWGEELEYNITERSFAIDVKPLRDTHEDHKFALRLSWELWDGTTQEQVVYEFSSVHNYTWFWSGAHNEQYSGVRYDGKTVDGYDRLVFGLNFLDKDAGKKIGDVPGTHGNVKKITKIQMSSWTTLDYVADIVTDTYVPYELKTFEAAHDFNYRANYTVESCSKVEFKMLITEVPESGDRRASLCMFNNSSWGDRYGYFNIKADMTHSYNGLTTTAIGGGWYKLVFDLNLVTVTSGTVPSNTDYIYIRNIWCDISGQIADITFLA